VNVKRVSLDCKAPGLIGDVSRGGLTRGENRACDHDLGLHEQDIPCGSVEEDRGQLHITFGSSSKTSDCIVDGLEAWWAALEHTEQVAMARLQSKMDNGPASSGQRPQFLQRMVAFGAALGKPRQLLYDPPYHSKDNPLERCWGILELHWNGTKLVEVEPMVEWAKTLTWKGIHPSVALSQKGYQKGMALGKAAMQAVEARLERHPVLPKYDLVIKPVRTS
jgi:Rhodopirellula transposase DDE domain